MLSISRCKALIILCLFVGLAGCMTGCTKNAEPAKVTFTLPAISTKVISSSPIAMTGTDSDEPEWGLSAPTSKAEIGCYAVYVGGPELEMSRHNCTTSSGRTIRFGYFAGMISAAQASEVSLVIPAGSARTFTLLGASMITGATCEQLPEITKSKYSYPLVLGQTTTSIVAGDNKVQLNGAVGTETLTSCDFGRTSTGGSPAIYLGSGSDGDVTFSTGATLASGSNSSGRSLATSAWMTNRTAVALTSDHLIALDGSFDSTHFGVGDEVMAYVVSEGTPNACGGDVYPGMRFFGMVTSGVTGSAPSYMRVKIGDPRFASIPVASLTGLPYIGQTNCRVSITRVPNLNNLTINNASVTTAQLNALNSGAAPGGILAMRVRGKLHALGANASIDATAKGYRGGPSTSKSGDGVLGAGTATVSNYGNAGSEGGTYAPGGGGHGGSGLLGLDSGSLSNPATSGQTMGDAFGCGTNDPLMRCLFGKIFMGGGGGHLGGGAIGNHGGGIITIYANEIDVDPGTVFIIGSNGGAGDSVNGGGAGGAVLVRTFKLNNEGTLWFKAKGGDAGSITSELQGAGGGGRIHVDVMDSCVSTSAINISTTGGTSGVSSPNPRTGNPGTYLKTGAAVSAASCQLP